MAFGAKRKSVVAIAKGTDPEKMVAEIFSLLGGRENLIRPRSTVVLKPNAGHPAAPETSVNTSPAVVAAMINEVKNANPKEIIVAESAAIGCDTFDVFDKSGIGAAAENAGARLVDIKKERDLINIPIRDARSGVKKIKLPRFLLEAEHLINMPIFKSHASMVFTCALKNLKGVVQDVTHQQMHQTDLAAAMMDVWSVIRPDLSVADMIRPAEGFGPHTTLPIEFGCLVGSKDPVALDATACRITGLGLDKVAYFAAANERQLGNSARDDIEVRGCSIEEAFKQLWFPYLEGFETWPEYNIHADGACSSCAALVAFSMEKLKALGQYEKNAGCTILLGPKRDEQMPKDVDPNSVVLVGDCLKRFRGRGAGHWVGNCPPLEPHVLWTIVDRRDFTYLEPDTRERMAREEGPWLAYIDKLREKRNAAQTGSPPSGQTRPEEGA
ncbi:MAG: DUF362 domain-containing protein [Actinobacteria bacterium]|nr:DUF362 domain-containing protein [Actinomycetota bacterium]